MSSSAPLSTRPFKALGARLGAGAGEAASVRWASGRGLSVLKGWAWAGAWSLGSTTEGEGDATGSTAGGSSLGLVVGRGEGLRTSVGGAGRGSTGSAGGGRSGTGGSRLSGEGSGTAEEDVRAEGSSRGFSSAGRDRKRRQSRNRDGSWGGGHQDDTHWGCWESLSLSESVLYSSFPLGALGAVLSADGTGVG